MSELDNISVSWEGGCDGFIYEVIYSHRKPRLKGT